MWYNTLSRPGIRNRIQIEDEAHKAVVDKLESLVVEINKILYDEFERGNIVRALGGVVSRSDGPALEFDILSVTNGFWKKEKNAETD